MSTTKEETECFSKEPLVESLAWPLPVIKKETKEDVPEDIAQVWIKKEYELPETFNEEDPLAVNTEQVSERVVKTEVKEEEQWENQQSTLPMEQMEEDSCDASDSTNNSLVFSCERCEVSYTSPLHLENHKHFCRGLKKPAVQVKPEEVTTDVQTLAKLVEGKKMYFCELCNYQTKRSWDIKRHLVTHTGVKPFSCEVCNKTFTQAGHLTQHKLIHTQDKLYKCTECSYVCNRASSLKTHMTIHTGEKVFACKLCRYQTAVSSDLTRHMRTHTDDKPYTCTQCEYKATQSSVLQRHVRAKHKMEKPYSCTHCDYKTAHSSQLKLHTQKKHRDNKPFSCAHCEYKAFTKFELSQHLKHKHLD